MHFSQAIAPREMDDVHAGGVASPLRVNVVHRKTCCKKTEHRIIHERRVAQPRRPRRRRCSCAQVGSTIERRLHARRWNDFPCARLPVRGGRGGRVCRRNETAHGGTRPLYDIVQASGIGQRLPRAVASAAHLSPPRPGMREIAAARPARAHRRLAQKSIRRLSRLARLCRPRCPPEITRHLVVSHSIPRICTPGSDFPRLCRLRSGHRVAQKLLPRGTSRPVSSHSSPPSRRSIGPPT